MMMISENKALLITGGTCSFGDAVLDRFIASPLTEMEVLCNLDPHSLLQAVPLSIAHHARFGPYQLVSDYAPDQVSWKIATIIASYTGYVSREVWKVGLA